MKIENGKTIYFLFSDENNKWSEEPYFIKRTTDKNEAHEHFVNQQNSVFSRGYVFVSTPTEFFKADVSTNWNKL